MEKGKSAVTDFEAQQIAANDGKEISMKQLMTSSTGIIENVMELLIHYKAIISECF